MAKRSRKHEIDTTEPARASMLEAEWKRLRRHIDLTGSGYSLVFVFVENKDEALTLRTRTLDEFAKQGGTSKVIVPETRRQLATLGLKLLGPDVVGQSCIWVEGLEDDPFGQMTSPWGNAWKELLMRLNERRDSLERHLSGMLILVLPLIMKNDVRDMAPDLWAIRGLVIDLPAPSKDTIEVTQGETFGEFVTASPAMKQVLELARNIAPSRIPVWIQGETGSGKELLARYIHEQSKRSGPFVAVNCGNFTLSLAAPALFGYVRGAFSGASRDRGGMLHNADKGTLVLDEIGDLAFDTQALLLRFLETGEVLQVGSTVIQHLDVRVIVTTNVNMDERIDKRLFREDLYYRLHGVELHVPPLRERPEDIPLLALQFLQKVTQQLSLPAIAIRPAAMKELLRHSWPGNARELRIALATMCVRMGNRHEIEPEDVAQYLQRSGFPSEETREAVAETNGRTFAEQIKQAEADIIKKALGDADGNITRAATRLGLSERTLRSKLKRYQLERGKREPLTPIKKS